MNQTASVYLDLSACKYLSEIHQRIKSAFAFPDYYGENWDAFYDMLCTENTAEKIIIAGESTVPEELQDQLEQMHRVIVDAQQHLLRFHRLLTYEIKD